MKILSVIACALVALLWARLCIHVAPVSVFLAIVCGVGSIKCAWLGLKLSKF